jgi:hypothetical protein
MRGCFNPRRWTHSHTDRQEVWGTGERLDWLIKVGSVGGCGWVISYTIAGMMMGLGKRVIADRGMMMGLGKRAFSPRNINGMDERNEGRFD